MAAVYADGSVPDSVPPLPVAVLDATAVDINTPGLREVCARLHMDPDPVNELQKPDIEFLLVS